MSLSKMIMGQSGNQGSGSGPNVEDVYSTFVYEGTSGNQNIVNGLDLSTEGGWVWFKRTNGGNDHFTVDNVRGLTKNLVPNSNGVGSTHSSVTYNTNGFSLSSNLGDNNESGGSYVAYSFRRAPRFFDIVTYTGDQVSGRTVSHNLGSTPGMIFIKKTDSSEDWSVFHRDLNINSGGNYTQFLRLNSTAIGGGTGSSASTCEDVQNVSSTTFTIGNDNRVNTNGATYIAYIFAHNNSDGGFGPDANDDIIKCGVYTGDGQAEGPTIDLGFEPQWLLFKCSSDSEGWYIVDNIREWTTDGVANALRPNATSFSTFDGSSSGVRIRRTGFQMSNNSNDNNGSNKTYIYMAIRRGPMAVPTSSSQVFAAVNGNSSGEPAFTSGFPVDLGIWHGDVSSTNENRLSSRLTQGRTLDTDSTAAEQVSTSWAFDYMTGFMSSGGSGNFATMWKRAPKYFDIVCYDGNNTSGRTVAHSLGVVPEMIWIKNRGYSAGEDWAVYHKGINAGTDPEDYFLYLNRSNAQANNAGNFNDTAPTSTVFTVGNDRRTNGNVADGNKYIAFLFATLAGVSKVGSYAGNGSSQNIDCGFSNGAKYVLIKSNQSGHWHFFDTTRGIVSGNDPHLKLSVDDFESNADSIDPLNSGFTVVQNSDTDLNKGPNDETYIFYAVAA